ncbi:signal peptidase II [Paracoccus suum]|uniref:Lipoprotein signal peptidase n=1 Tax=Paracoccus suum TaxID=2259340 RepID=A0A344PIF8_9RHOB|nr:signal peptidase II [Paracoccus suum]AXC49163.1 signal peptidase II [Paracoccus suum]
MAAPTPPGTRAGPAAPKPPRKRTPKAKPVGAAGPRASAKNAAPVPPAPADWPLRLTAITAAATIAVDQASKWLVVQTLDLATLRELDVIDPFLNLRMAWNQGVNFGLFSGGADIMRWVLVAIAIAVCIWVTLWVRRARPGRYARIAAGLLIGGALGNVIDRITYGAVADFLNMSLPGWTNPYSFNLADIAIFAGAIGLVLQPQPDKARDDAGKTR